MATFIASLKNGIRRLCFKAVKRKVEAWTIVNSNGEKMCTHELWVIAHDPGLPLRYPPPRFVDHCDHTAGGPSGMYGGDKDDTCCVWETKEEVEKAMATGFAYQGPEFFKGLTAKMIHVWGTWPHD